jgi:hypothetical protein
MLNEYRMQTYLIKSTKLSIAHTVPYFPSFVLCAAGVVAEVFSHDAWLA